MPLKNSDKLELENCLKLDGSHKMVGSLKKNCNRRIVLTDKPFYVTEAVNEDLKNYVSLKSFIISWMLLMNFGSIRYGVNVLQIDDLTILAQNGRTDLFF